MLTPTPNEDERYTTISKMEHLVVELGRVTPDRVVKSRAKRPVGVSVFVLTTAHILLGRRGPDCKRGAGCLALPGGMLDAGETISDLILREMREETGLQVSLNTDEAVPFEVPGILAVTDHLEPSGNQDLLPHLSLWVLTRYGGGTPTRTEPGKCEGWDWYDAKDILAIPGADDPTTEQYYWTPLPLWRRILKPYIDLRV